MSYCEMLETRFERFIKNKNLLGATKCVEDLFGLKPRIATNVAELVYKQNISLEQAVDHCVDKEFKEGKI